MTTIYFVERFVEGTVDEWRTVVRAQTPEGAGEVCRILLAQRDPEIRVIRVRVMEMLQ
jgi:hypothetical protein